MNFELNSPTKVKPYFIKSASLIEKSPLLFYRIGFSVMTFTNFILLYFLFR